MSLASSLNKFREYDNRVRVSQHELSELDGSQDPVKCLSLIGKLKEHQNKLIEAVEEICIHVARHNHHHHPPSGSGNSQHNQHNQHNQVLLDRHHRWKFSPKTYETSAYFNPQLYFAIEALDAGGVIEGNILLSEDLRAQASALLRTTEDLRRVFRNQVESLVAAKQGGQKRTFLTPEILKTVLKFDSQWSAFEAQYLIRAKEPRSPRDVDVLLQLACFMDDCITRLLKIKLITQEMVNDFEPSLMISLPRILILRGIRIQSGLAEWLDGKMFALIKPKIAHASHLVQDLTAEQYRELEKRLVDPEYEVEGDDSATGVALRNLFMQLCDVADTLQRGENAAEMRSVLKAAFQMNQAEQMEPKEVSPRISSEHPQPQKMVQPQPRSHSPPPQRQSQPQPQPQPQPQQKQTIARAKSQTKESNKEPQKPPTMPKSSSLWSFFSAPVPSKPVKMKPSQFSLNDSTDPLTPKENQTACTRCSASFSSSLPPVICGLCCSWFCENCAPFKVPANDPHGQATTLDSVPSIRVCKRCYAFES